jgi:hypothetical protein
LKDGGCTMRGSALKKSVRTFLVVMSWVALVAAGPMAQEQCVFAQDGFPAMPKITPKHFSPGIPQPGPAAPKGLFPGKWKLEITEDIEKPKEPELKKECPVPAILEKLQAPGPAIKINIKKPKCDNGKNKKNGNDKDKSSKANGKNDDKNGKDDGNGDEEEDERPDLADDGWDVDRPWISATQG